MQVDDAGFQPVVRQAQVAACDIGPVHVGDALPSVAVDFPVAAVLLVLVAGQQVECRRPVAELIAVLDVDAVVVHRLPAVQPGRQMRPGQGDADVLRVGVIEHRQAFAAGLQRELVVQFVGAV